MRLVQTHASWVCLVPPFVFKVKKPVNFGFLDFSTLDKRRHFCEREVVLNRRLCPGVYLGVVPITIARGRLAFGGSGKGKVVEYAVQMRRLAEGRFLNQLVKRGVAGRSDLNRVAAVLRRFYQSQQPTGEIEAWGKIGRLRISTDENFRQVRRFAGAAGATGAERAPLSRIAFDTIRFYTQRFYRGNVALFASRVRDRWIRDCHGDLHLDHIHVTPRALHIYDCIEFNDRLRYVDVASDVAFLAMDLDYEGRANLGSYVAARMAAELKDGGMLRLMDFYKCYRAFVRGKVESLQSVAPAAPESERHACAERAQGYFRLALQYAIAGSRPLALVVMGRIASGKSTLARALGTELGWTVLSSDALRKKLAGIPLHKRSDAAARGRIYSDAMTKRTYERLIDLAATELTHGRPVILDATFSRRDLRKKLIQRLGRIGIAGRFLEVEASDATIKRRLRGRARAAKTISDARLEDFGPLTKLYARPVELPAGIRIRIRTSGSLEQAVKLALRGLVNCAVSFPRPPRGGMRPTAL